MKDFSLLEKKLGIKFKNKDLLKQAFVHRSYLNENPGLGLEQNERLEFLGDAVLELIITEYLYKKYTEKAEGELKEIGKARQYILANTFEAFIGAAYLDSGYEIVEGFIEKYLLVKLPNI